MGHKATGHKSMRSKAKLPKILDEIADKGLKKKLTSASMHKFQPPKAFQGEGKYEAFLTIIKEGNFEAVAVQKLGIAKQTYNDWMARGRKGQGDWHHKFYLDVLEAKADAEIELVGYIKKNAKSDYRAALAILRQQHPHRWGERNNLSVGGSVVHQHVIDDRRTTAKVINADPEQLENARKLIASDGED